MGFSKGIGNASPNLDWQFVIYKIIYVILAEEFALTILYLIINVSVLVLMK